jgi:hypothetical protein
MAATDVLLDCQKKRTPVTSLLLLSNARAVNCCCWPVSMLAEEGDTSTRAIIGPQGLNGEPFN